MTILSAKQIRKFMQDQKLIVTREGKEITVNPASIDIHFGDRFTAFKYSHRTFIDSRQLEDPVSNESIKPDGRRIIYHKYTDEYLGCEEYYVHDKDAVLAVSQERIRLPDDMCAKFYGSAALLRLGLEVRSSTSWSEQMFEPGFKGDIRFFVRNNAWMPVKIYPDQVAGRLVFETLDTE